MMKVIKKCTICNKESLMVSRCTRCRKSSCEDDDCVKAINDTRNCKVLLVEHRTQD